MSHEMERAESSLQDDSADRAIYRVGLERANLQTVPCKGNLLTLPLTRVVLLAEQAGTSLLLANTDQRSPVVRLSDTRLAARRNATPEKWQREGEASEKKRKNITRTTLNFSWHRCLLSFFVSLLFVWFGFLFFVLFLFLFFWGAKNPPAARLTTQQTRPLSELHIVFSLSAIWLVVFFGVTWCVTHVLEGSSVAWWSALPRDRIQWSATKHRKRNLCKLFSKLPR